ncbi:MAG: hypothetical protein WB439_14700 [Acidobacteriaceae bacterium]
MKHEIDIDLIAKLLRNHGHTVGHIIPIPDNGGEYEFEVDGTLLSLSETRGLIELEDEKQEAKRHASTTDAHASAPPTGTAATP